MPSNEYMYHSLHHYAHLLSRMYIVIYCLLPSKPYVGRPSYLLARRHTFGVQVDETWLPLRPAALLPDWISALAVSSVC